MKKRKTFALLNYKLHLWVGLLTSVFVVVLSVTGILLNHKRDLGLMISPDQQANVALTEALPLATLLQKGIDAFNHLDYQNEKSINRMDFRPGKGYIKVRFRDPNTTEVILDVFSGNVISLAPRQDVFIEHLHSGELFGDIWIILSDIAAVALILLTFGGIYIWIYAKYKRRKLSNPGSTK